MSYVGFAVVLELSDDTLMHLCSRNKFVLDIKCIESLVFVANQKEYQNLFACQIGKSVGYVSLCICLGVMTADFSFGWKQIKNFRGKYF